MLQDPYSSLNPRTVVRDIVAEPLECLRVPGDHDARVEEIAGLTTAFGLSLVLVSHDIGVVQQLCDRLLVLKDGVLAAPSHPYTRALPAAVPQLPEEV
ncbi:hypothetical protein [Amycolatopsis sp. WQ 127309]|uniref:hypothetical protein n=1 Tax=Amycolatopsis sp. WQ 127309 TaxID=2932773 RepID=UPI001FF1BCDF|nr:hypothetical protein [Amycolatopsis sp. WQ 127309]UOZ04927.1 hypothetical protein MUY22_39845 [Amycolatopsis sp. WQ 127309]